MFIWGLTEIVNVYDTSIQNVKLLPHPVYIVIWGHESPAASHNIKELPVSNYVSKEEQHDSCFFPVYISQIIWGQLF